MKRSIVLLCALLAIAVLPAHAAGDLAAGYVAPESLRAAFEGSLNRQVTLVLGSGQELTGTVARVGERVVHLSRITGRDFFDAVVLIERVDAVILKARGR